jgi:ATP-dependent RNA helicase DDX27
MCPKRRQTMLFSATMTEEVDALVQLSLNSPVRLSADPSTKRPVTLSEEVVKIRPALEGDKEAVLLALCTRTFRSKVIIFRYQVVDTPVDNSSVMRILQWLLSLAFPWKFCL